MHAYAYIHTHTRTQMANCQTPRLFFFLKCNVLWMSDVPMSDVRCRMMSDVRCRMSADLGAPDKPSLITLPPTSTILLLLSDIYSYMSI